MPPPVYPMPWLAAPGRSSRLAKVRRERSGSAHLRAGRRSRRVGWRRTARPLPSNVETRAGSPPRAGPSGRAAATSVDLAPRGWRAV